MFVITENIMKRPVLIWKVTDIKSRQNIPCSGVCGSVQSILLDVRSKMKDCSRFIAGIVISNTADGMNVRPLRCVSCS